ncbi:MAG: hypothetical protein ABIC57_02885, partial [bacterium]
GWKREVEEVKWAFEEQKLIWSEAYKDRLISSRQLISLIDIGEKELTEKLKIYYGDFFDGVKVGHKEMMSTMETDAQAGLRAWRTVMNSMESVASEYFFDLFTGKLKDLRDYWRSFTNSLLREFSNMVSQMITRWLIMQAIMAGAKAIGGYYQASTTSAMPGGEFAAAQHSGGLIKRYHPGGLASDEVPAILQKGEYVIRRSAVTNETLPLLKSINAKRFHDGSSSEVQQDGGNGKMEIHIHAVDAPSFVALLSKNRDALAPLFSNLYDRNTSVRKSMRG